MFVLELCRGEYDDHANMPIATVADQDSAELVREAIEAREEPYFSLIPADIRENIIQRNEAFSIDLLYVPFLDLGN